MNHRSIFAFAAVLLAAAPAHAAPKTDLTVAINAPSGTHVYESGHYTVQVSNLSNRNAGSVVLTIQLPVTHTTPVHIMGTLGARDSRCAVSGTKLVCSLGSVGAFSNKTVFFDITFPHSAAALDIDASVTTTTQESNYGNNSARHTASPLTYPVTMSPPDAAVNQHCTGQGLTSYHECTLFPSSISSHDTVFNGDGSISFPGAPPEYTGSWSQPAADRLHFEYFELGTLVATFEGYGVSPTCFEGPTTFPGSTYMSMYRVCLQ